MKNWPGVVVLAFASLALGQEPPADRKAAAPLPLEKTNCVRCHLTAGRELTRPVRDFARSVHDLAGLSCNSCHGGNITDDATAHAPEHEFIGTKLSAHLAACGDCHASQAEALSKGPHHWDQARRINKDYPMCIDCHGNHDVGKPPADFSLTAVCTDCHKQAFAQKMPHAAEVVAENDRLWEILRKVQEKNRDAAERFPPAVKRELARVRGSTARLIHPAAQITPEEARVLNERSKRLRQELEAWLREN